MNKNYKKVQNVLIYDKKEKYIFFYGFFEKMHVFFSKIVWFCTVKEKKIVRFYVRFF